jgi:hypothetical protein
MKNYHRVLLFLIGMCIAAILSIATGLLDLNPYFIGYIVLFMLFLASCLSMRWIKFVLRVR